MQNTNNYIVIVERKYSVFEHFVGFKSFFLLLFYTEKFVFEEYYCCILSLKNIKLNYF